MSSTGCLKPNPFCPHNFCSLLFANSVMTPWKPAKSSNTWGCVLALWPLQERSYLMSNEQTETVLYQINNDKPFVCLLCSIRFIFLEIFDVRAAYLYAVIGSVATGKFNWKK
jgi:hypothetical protein